MSKSVQGCLDYGKAISFDELVKAAKQCDNSVSWKSSVIKWMFNLYQNITELRNRILNGTYHVSKYVKFEITEPKRRIIYSTKFIDRVLQRSLCNNGLYHALTKSLIYDNGACQVGKGTSFTLKRFERMLHGYYEDNGHSNVGYAIKLDIHNYFGSTPHELLKECVAKVVDEPHFKHHVFEIIDSFEDNRRENEISKDPFGRRGIGLGSQVSQLLELLYLNDLDHYIKETLKIRQYIRYMDDMILFVKKKKDAVRIFADIKSKIEAKGLTLNPKSQIMPIQNGIKFLKVNFRLTETGKVKKRVSNESISKELRRISTLLWLFKNGNIDYDYLLMHFNSWVGHFKKRMASKQFAVLNTHIKRTIERLGIDHDWIQNLRMKMEFGDYVDGLNKDT